MKPSQRQIELAIRGSVTETHPGRRAFLEKAKLFWAMAREDAERFVTPVLDDIETRAAKLRHEADCALLWDGPRCDCLHGAFLTIISGETCTSD